MRIGATGKARVQFWRYGLIFLILAACGDESPVYTPQFSTTAPVSDEMVYIFSVHPLHNPTRLHEIFDPLMTYLSEHIEGASFRLEASRNYASYNEKLYAGTAHFSLPNPYQTLNSLKHGYTVFGKMADDENFRGIILVRKDSNINKVSDLKGKTISYPAPTALAATMLPQYYLHTHGLDVNKDVKTKYVGSQESSIMNVYLGDVAAAATWPPPWNALKKERPEVAEALEIKWQTDNLPNNGLVVRNDVPERVRKLVAELLFNLHKHKEGQVILARMELSRFEPADNHTYDPVQAFIITFSREVRPVE